MNKKELTTQVIKQTGLTAVAASKAVDGVFRVIRKNLEKGQRTTIHGFGSFSVTNYAERRGINPSTLQPMTISAHKVAKFSPSKNMVIK